MFRSYGLFFGGGNVSEEMRKKFGNKETQTFIQETK